MFVFFIPWKAQPTIIFQEPLVVDWNARFVLKLMLANELDDIDDANNDNNSKIHAVLWKTNLRIWGGGIGGTIQEQSLMVPIRQQW